MEKQIKKEAKKLYEEVLREYYSREEWEMRPLSIMIDDKLKGYNDAVKTILETEIYGILSEQFGKDIPSVIPTPKTFSQMLYKNAKEVSARVFSILKDVSSGKRTLTEIARMIYDGYGYRSKEVMIVHRELPKYIQDYLRGSITKKQFEREISKLRTKPLRTANKAIVKAIDEMNEISIKSALKTHLEEKSRYYANRIAQTEQQRAITLSMAKEYLNDEEIEFMKFRMSSRHPMVDICDYYANLDVGYGRGIIQKKDMVTLPLHPHCMCRYDPYYKRAEKRKPKSYMDGLSEEKQKAILGGWDNLKKFKSGEPPEKIFNDSREKYKIKKVATLL